MDLINDFNDFLKENNYKISVDWEINEKYINEYLMSIFYNIRDDVEDIEEEAEIEKVYYNILDNYCKNPNIIRGFI